MAFICPECNGRCHTRYDGTLVEDALYVGPAGHAPRIGFGCWVDQWEGATAEGEGSLKELLKVAPKYEKALFAGYLVAECGYTRGEASAIVGCSDRTLRRHFTHLRKNFARFSVFLSEMAHSRVVTKGGA